MLRSSAKINGRESHDSGDNYLDTRRAREGIDLSRQSMSGWVIQLHERLSTLMDAMKRLLHEGEVIQIDETRLQVLKEPGRKNTQLSYMWVYGGGPPDRPVIWYQYADSRSGEVP